MSKALRIMIALAVALGLALAVGQAAATEANEPPKGAKALFGQGNEEVFFPRPQGTGRTSQMDPTNQVTETMLTSFYKKPEFPGIAYSLELIRAGEGSVRTVADPRRHEFHTGDRVRIRLVPNFTGHAYVLEAKHGSSKLVYPVSFGTPENQVVAGRETYVPISGWLRLTEPAEPFTMRVLFKPGPADYPLNQPQPNPAAARVALTEAVDREWQAMKGSKALVFEADNSYVNAMAAPPPPMPQQQVAGTPAPPPQPMPAEPVPVVNRSQYTTNYVVVDPAKWQASAPASQEPAIAIEVPIRHVSR